MTDRFAFDIPFAEYRGLPGASITTLKNIERSALHYQNALMRPKDTAPLSLGRAAHCATLEPARFAADYIVYEGRRAGKVWEAFEEAHKDVEILSPTEYAAATAISEAVRSKPRAMRYLHDGRPEVTMLWTEDGMPCKGRLDWLPDDQATIVGLKTAADSGPTAFGLAAARYGYTSQWAHYLSGSERIIGRRPRVVEIVVESAPPYDVVVYEIPEDILEIGEDARIGMMARLRECERANHWPGVAEAEVVLTMPAWWYPSEDDNIGGLGLTGLEDSP